MKIIARILLVCIVAALAVSGIYAFKVIDTAAKNTASYLEEQTVFSVNGDSLVILNNEIPLRNEY